MIAIIHFETFLLSAILLNLTPGNDTVYILSKSLAEGKRAGLLSMAGIATGSLIHTTLAALGVGLLISHSPFVFAIVRYTGAAYLAYVGIRMIVVPPRLETAADTGRQSLNRWVIYRDAVLTNVFNPKVALFFIAFIPQFIDPNCSKPLISFLLLGITFTITGSVWCSLLAAFAGTIGERLRSGGSQWVGRTCGTVLVLLALRVALVIPPTR